MGALPPPIRNELFLLNGEELNSAQEGKNSYLWGGAPTKKTWRSKITIIIGAADLLAIVASLLTAHIYKFGFINPEIDGRYPLPMTYLSLGVIWAVIWWLFVQASGSRSVRILGYGDTEFKLVTKATAYFFSVILAFSYLTEIDFARSYFVVSFIIGILLINAERLILRRLIVNSRAKGRLLTPMLIVADEYSAQHMESILLSSVNQSGFKPVAHYLAGVSNQSFEAAQKKLTIPVIGRSTEPQDIVDEISKQNIQAVAISSGHKLTPEKLRELGWLLAANNIALVMAPALTDIAGPRIHTTPLNGVPLIHVSTPRIEGFAGALKRIMDVLASGLGLIVISPLLIVVAALIAKDRGPIFYSQERIGLHGGTFRMWKFRSMVTNADELKKKLIEENGGNALLFKMENDPRVTKIGKFIRRYSIDELPQLWNVFIGDMSLVGPRPQVQDEVNLYTRAAHRRLLVRPGLTGLWQVSGRSKLSWDEALRLDLYYVENWSLMTDVQILLKTVKAVVGKDGAY